MKTTLINSLTEFETIASEALNRFVLSFSKENGCIGPLIGHEGLECVSGKGQRLYERYCLHLLRIGQRLFPGQDMRIQSSLITETVRPRNILPYLSAEIINRKPFLLGNIGQWDNGLHPADDTDLENCILIEIPDQSMAPQIKAGAIIRARWVSPEKYSTLSKVVAAGVGDKVYIRRVIEITDTWLHLGADNTDYPNASIPLENLRWIYQVEHVLAMPVY